MADTAETDAKHDRRKQLWGRLRLLVIPTVALALAAAAIVAVLRLERTAHDARQSQVTYERIGLQTERLERIALQTGVLGSTPQLRAARVEARTQLLSDLDRLAELETDDPENVAQVTAALFGAQNAFRELKPSLKNGELPPSLEQAGLELNETLADVSADEAAEADAAARWSSIGTAIVIGLMAILISLVYWRFHRSQVRQAARTSEALRSQAERDPLTGLPNRRRLIADLNERMTLDTEDRAMWTLAFFDLDGFKAYNDTYGHPQGDALLVRLGGELTEAAGPDATAYRLGGDEFCVLATIGADRAAPAAEDWTAALSDRGEGFAISASSGAVNLGEVETTSAALQLADRRMYRDKETGPRSTPQRQAHDVALQALAELKPDVWRHTNVVSNLARAVGQDLGMEEATLQDLELAAGLHDIGKIAIPERILEKPGPLTDAERRFVELHTVIGERILAAAPALTRAARLVRSSHERYDGDGYPDGLAGDEIPLSSRIVLACDAFDAMTSERPYREQVSPEEALEELRRCAGSQFDPAVVAAFERVLALRAEGLDAGEEDPTVGGAPNLS